MSNQTVTPRDEVQSSWKRITTAVERKILVFGVWGALGRELARILLEDDCSVRFVLQPERVNYFRELQEAGVECVEMDLEDSNSVDRAFVGVQKFVMFTDLGLVENLFAKTAALVDGCKRNNVSYVTTVSYIGEEKWHRPSEKLILNSGIPFTIIHMNLLFQSFLALKNHDTFKLPMGNAKVGWVDACDVADIVKKILSAPIEKHNGKLYLVCGPELLSCIDIAEVLSEITQRKIIYVPISENEARNNLSNDPEWLVNSKLDIWAKNKDGWTAVLSPDVESVLGKKPCSFLDFSRAHSFYWE